MDVGDWTQELMLLLKCDMHCFMCYTNNNLLHINISHNCSHRIELFRTQLKLGKCSTGLDF